ncbi:PTS glucose transporter subunit IIABC [Lactobacillus sp. CBA3606]|uniref:PTS sugar transporter subunit IIA n=1 Tax=Lactobacillus sp. CBA3606 TaxID=2099789 RepID=UPI000CFCCA2C|nr:PTS glucose transporter subunit IIA [Lactobacillus sp. CBA3606]AVK63024.1 PTS glucose transporter subunit IIABC [Lactobacillus sp. CBA3606]
MFGLKKKNKLVRLGAIATGQLMPITAVTDQVFSQKMMGDGFAITPSTGQIVAPAAGEIKTIAATKHAIMMTTATGLELMLHLGLDTVELNGAPFTVQVKVGDQVQLGTPLVTMDLAAIQAAGKATTVMTVVTNMDQVTNLTAANNQAITAGEVAVEATLA